MIVPYLFAYTLFSMKDNRLLLATSMRTGRTWCGGFWTFNDANAAPNISEAVTGSYIDCCVSRSLWLSDFQIISALDSGAFGFCCISCNFSFDRHG